MHELAGSDSGHPRAQGAPKYWSAAFVYGRTGGPRIVASDPHVFTLRYAHVFYRSKLEVDVDGSGGGLIFPGKGNPNYRDFAYFSFIIGMTCQVSDVSVTSHSMRLLALLHGLLSFAFNTVILALSINIISGLFVN